MIQNKTKMIQHKTIIIQQKNKIKQKGKDDWLIAV
jgi:hypothetical protein